MVGTCVHSLSELRPDRGQKECQVLDLLSRLSGAPDDCDSNCLRGSIWRATNGPIE
jgi:hypothetical protein